MTHPVQKPTFCEFFAGGGMARLGLGEDWRCVFANEWSEQKAAAYRAMFGACPELHVGDVAKVGPELIPERPTLVWGSFPCQDLSLAGNGAGLSGERSGTFKPFWRLVKRLAAKGRPPSLVVLENVVGTLTSHDGSDFAYICEELTRSGYKFGALLMDAVHFLPQSRPRLFIVGALPGALAASGVAGAGPAAPWHTKGLIEAYGKISAKAKRNWVWWRLPVPGARRTDLEDLIEAHPTGVEWHTGEQTARLLGMMSDVNRAKVGEVQASGERRVGTLYRRTRPDVESGAKVQRAEVRFDGVAGCLRTPAGGSSRQTIIEVNGDSIRTRLLSPREAARLMGAPDSYPIPENYNEAYHLFGDGLAVPVVGWLSKHLLLRLAGHAAITVAA